MLNLARRHSATKCGKTKKRDCTCPIWVTGSLNGKQIRKTLGVRNWTSAQKIVRDWEANPEGSAVSIKEAFERFLANCEARNIGAAQVGKYRLLEREMVPRFGTVPVNGVSVDDLSAYQESWKLSGISSQKKVERLRTFFKFCMKRGWCGKNPASDVELPKLKRRQVVPFEDEEITKIMAAVEQYPERPPGRRAEVRAFVLLLRYTGLRIGDVVKLSRKEIAHDEILLHTTKTGVLVRLPLPEEVLKAVNLLPHEGPRYFWSGSGLLKSAVADWQRSLARLFELAGISHGHAHRFRHTLAVKLLSKGVAVNHVAAILGNSPAVVEKHYSAWVTSRQDALNEAVRATF